MKITDFLSKKAIKAELKAKSKKAVLKELVDLLLKAGCLETKNKDKVLHALLEREELGTTAIGAGIALPHAKTAGVEKTALCLGRSIPGIDFDSIDNKPVHLFFLLVTPLDSNPEYIKVLARISRLLKHKYFRTALIKAGNIDEMSKIITEAETLI